MTGKPSITVTLDNSGRVESVRIAADTEEGESLCKKFLTAMGIATGRGARGILFKFDPEGRIESSHIFADTSRDLQVCNAALARTGLYIPLGECGIAEEGESTKVH